MATIIRNIAKNIITFLSIRGIVSSVADNLARTFSSKIRDSLSLFVEIRKAKSVNGMISIQKR